MHDTGETAVQADPHANATARWLNAVRSRFLAEPGVLLPLCAANSIAFLPLLTMPWLVGVLSREAGYSAGASGAIVTFDSCAPVRPCGPSGAFSAPFEPALRGVTVSLPRTARAIS